MKRHLHMIWLVGLIAALAIAFLASKPNPQESLNGFSTPLPTDEKGKAAGTTEGKSRYPVTIQPPSKTPRIALGHGQEVACSVCHDARQPNRETGMKRQPVEFHTSMKFSHGQLSCLACHNEGNYDQLKLADGRAIPYSQVMDLCAQCHGQQKTAFDHGAHGGMKGHWDLNRGPRQRNHCVDCHSPHQPTFPKMQRTFKPIDRFLKDPSGRAH